MQLDFVSDNNYRRGRRCTALQFCTSRKGAIPGQVPDRVRTRGFTHGGDIGHSSVDLSIDQRGQVAFLSVAAPGFLKSLDGRLLDSSDARDLREIRLACHMAGHKRWSKVSANLRWIYILRLAVDLRSGAIERGAYGCPPQHIAREASAILFNREFAGWFKKEALGS